VNSNSLAINNCFEGCLLAMRVHVSHTMLHMLPLSSVSNKLQTVSRKILTKIVNNGAITALRLVRMQFFISFLIPKLHCFHCLQYPGWEMVYFAAKLPLSAPRVFILLNLLNHHYCCCHYQKNFQHRTLRH